MFLFQFFIVSLVNPICAVFLRLLFRGGHCKQCDLRKSSGIHNQTGIILCSCICDEERRTPCRHSHTWHANCDSSLVRLVDKCGTCRGHSAPHLHLENRLGSLVQTVFIGEIASVFWLDQTVFVIIADGPKDIEPCIEISPHYFLFSFRLIVHAPLLLLSLHFSLSLCCSVCFLWRK